MQLSMTQWQLVRTVVSDRKACDACLQLTCILARGVNGRKCHGVLIIRYIQSAACPLQNSCGGDGAERDKIA